MKSNNIEKEKQKDIHRLYREGLNTFNELCWAFLIYIRDRREREKDWTRRTTTDRFAD